jgi:hypothetical protein
MFCSIQRLFWLFVLTLPLCSFSDAQGKKAPLVGERDKGKEDQLAQSVETIRAAAKLPPLARIRNRPEIRQRVCTVAQSDVLPKNSVGDTFVLYKTSHPESISTELKLVATFDDDHFPRYSVAVWRLTEPQSMQATYWVGIKRYWSASFEFVDYHFTDDIFYHDDWKKNVAPQCQGK